MGKVKADRSLDRSLGGEVKQEATGSVNKFVHP
ncbi:hypothetical protein Pse7367_0769 [Thalassoporum mexicanum PCC 7367]|nr:hypothetical protein Pse7367_0769 [Pseudanabaena sp. PCC 7367]